MTKKILLFLSLFVFANFLFAQTSSTVVINTTANNVLYRGIANPITIFAHNYDKSQISLSVSGGAIISKGKIKGFDGEYIVTIPTNVIANDVTINVKIGSKIVGSKIFKIMNVPNPIIKIGDGKNGEDIAKATFRTSPKLDAVLEGGLFPFNDLEYTVTSFTYVREVRGVTSSQVVSGNTIPEEVLSDISRKASGSTISFLDIKIVTPSGNEFTTGFTARLK